jgi:tRNA G18 (ribose-2'-O)-methylase SpoU
MNVISISDPRDPRVRSYQNITDAELVRAHGLFVAEGRLIVERVLADRRYHVESLLLNEASLDALRPALQSADVTAPVFQCPTSAFAAISGINLHRGCLALVRRPPASPWTEVVKRARLVVVLEGVTNADNVGGVFRNAAAFGAGAVLLSPTCCDPLYRKAIRTSMAAALQVSFARVEPWPEALDRLRAHGFMILALTPREPSQTLEAFVASRTAQPLALLIGSEGPGLSDSAERAADVRVRIPINPEVDSLNLAVATGIALSRLQAAF